jgi:cytochrome P450/nitrite reductase/ring-hydroxylating ferredoxin subunit
MKPDSFSRVAKLDELTGDGPFAISANGRDVVLIRTPSGWRAFEGRCPHQGALLGEGEIDVSALVCRNHRWRFSLDTGQRIGGSECLASFPATERDGQVYVDVSGSKAPAAERQTAAKRPLSSVSGPKGLPILGNAHQIDPVRAHLVFEAWAREYGPTFRFRAGPRTVYATSDPTLIEEALGSRPETFRRNVMVDEVLTEAGIRGVFNAEGDAWRPQRKLAVAALAQRHLKALYPHILTVAGRFKRRWEKAAAADETLDVVEEMKRLTVDITTLIAFGRDSNTIEQSEDRIQSQLELVLPTINRRIVAPFPIWRYLKLPRDRRFDRAIAAVLRWLETLLTETRGQLAVNPGRAAQPSNFIEAMLVAEDENGAPFSDETIISNLLTMLIAGEDTTAFTLTWAVNELCESPRWAAELRREADDILGAAALAPDVEVANRLPIANAVASETMRLRPAAPVNGVTAKVDTTLGDFIVPKGSTILLLTRPMAVDGARFADPEAFRPERWLGGAKGAHDISAYGPFGSGPRLCPGRSLALIEMKTILSMLYKAFDIERVGRAEEVSERFGFTMGPVGLRVRVRARSAERRAA